MKELNLEQPEIAWHTVRDRIAEVGCFLGLVTGTCGKIAFDVKLLMQPRSKRSSSRSTKAAARRHHAAEAQPDFLGLHHRRRPAWCASKLSRCSMRW